MRGPNSFLIAFAVAVATSGYTPAVVSAFSLRATQIIPIRVSTESTIRKFKAQNHYSSRSSTCELRLAATESGRKSSVGSNESPRSFFVVRTLAIMSISAILWKRQTILSFLTYVKDDWLVIALDRLHSAGPAGLFAYTLAFLIWEMTFGITTPIETAAGFAFGAIPAIITSGSGKLLGSLFTFLLARYKFKDRVKKKTEGNELLSLMEESVQETPFRVALLCRFSPLPEFAKNAGMGVLPVPLHWYILSLLVHGLSFTCLWSCMGAETGNVFRGSKPSKTLKYLITGATWIGFSAPIYIGFWIKSLRDKRKARRQIDTDKTRKNDE